MENFKLPENILCGPKFSEEDKPKFVVPVKSVKSMADMGIWQKSEAYHDLIGFINGISAVIQGKPNSVDCHISKIMSGLLKVFDHLNTLIDETPPLEQPQRFGNQAYRSWFQKMSQNASQYLFEALTEEHSEAIIELSVYLIESFGNPTRIDYGTGHELSFVMFMCCLFKINALAEADNVASALKLFNKYLIFVRRLQKTYRMEPAGSQGVWSLDDYQFIPFIWGSAQLSVKSPFEPAKFLDEPIIQKYKDQFMYIGCIDYICQVKTGHFAEHSNQLWSISAVPTWSKINSGLIKMYQKEILSKFPVIQHVLFGSLLRFKAVKPGTVLQNVRLGFITQTCTPESVVTPPCTPQSTLQSVNLQPPSMITIPSDDNLPVNIIISPSSRSSSEKTEEKIGDTE